MLRNSSGKGGEITFRPHHFMCTLGFEGKGYSPAFVKNYIAVKSQVTSFPDVPIQVVDGLDSVCKACPNKRAQNQCEKQIFIEKLDQNHSHVLDIRAGDVMTWNQAKQRIKEKMTLGKFKTACAGCSWQELGICEKALKSLLAEKDDDFSISQG